MALCLQGTYPDCSLPKKQLLQWGVLAARGLSQSRLDVPPPSPEREGRNVKGVE